MVSTGQSAQVTQKNKQRVTPASPRLGQRDDLPVGGF